MNLHTNEKNVADLHIRMQLTDTPGVHARHGYSYGMLVTRALVCQRVGCIRADSARVQAVMCGVSCRHACNAPDTEKTKNQGLHHIICLQ